MCTGCNGYGVLRIGGKKFTMRGKGKHITEGHPAHDACHGTGLMACGCTELDETALQTLTGVSAPADVEIDDAWAEHTAEYGATFSLAS